eukprot:6172428-Pleurochrysis_carterae.AAC.3
MERARVCVTKWNAGKKKTRKICQMAVAPECSDNLWACDPWIPNVWMNTRWTTQARFRDKLKRCNATKHTIKGVRARVTKWRRHREEDDGGSGG